MAIPTFYWHDYETFGVDPRRDRPAQFAGLRTNMDLEPIAEPMVIYCKPSDDLLPQPQACLLTGITPQMAERMGTGEADFAARIHEELAIPGTCSAGYNSLRFDEEVTRHLLYRNFFDPYAREWENGNSRWDIIDLARLTYALRPDGIEWPRQDDGNPSFRLGELSAANHLSHTKVHDALGDVEATLALARLIRRHQPRLFEFYFQLRRKQRALELLDYIHMTPVVHVSSRYPASHGCLAMVVPLAVHPTQPNAIIAYDLRTHPSALLEFEPEKIAQRVFTAQAALPEGESRIPLKLIHINRTPALAPLSALQGADHARIKLDVELCLAHLTLIQQSTTVAEKVRTVFSRPTSEAKIDPELALYEGGFLNDHDRPLLREVRKTAPAQLGARNFAFRDPRYTELLFRYRARNYPDTLNLKEATLWEDFRRRKLTIETALTSITLDQYFTEITRLRQSDVSLDARKSALLDELEIWGHNIIYTNLKQS